MNRRLAVALSVAALALTSACGGDTEPDATTEGTSSASSKSAEEPKGAKKEPVLEPKKINVAAVKATFKAGVGGRAIRDMCDAAYSPWGCFYEDVEAVNASTIRVTLTTDGGRGPSDLDAVATDAGTHWFNFVGMDHPDLDVIIVRVNGVDHNVYRTDIPMLNM